MNGLVRRLAAVVGVVVAVAVLVSVAEDTRRTVDLTAGDSLSLSAETREVVKRIHTEVDVTAFVERSDPTRTSAAALLSRYRRLNRHIDVHLVDPKEAPGDARRLGLEPAFGGLAVTAGDELERAALVSEQDVTAALARLLRGTHALVCFAAGHGEADPESSATDGLSQAAGVMTRNGYRLEIVDLLTRTEVPAGCDALVLANPTAPMGPAEDAVRRYFDAGGKALVLGDPSSSLNLSSVSAPLGIRFLKGLVLEGDADLRMPGDPFTLAVLRYASTSPVARRLPPTVFPGAGGLEVDEDTDVPGLSVTAIIRTSPLAYLETRPAAPAFDPAADRAGPLVVAAGADRSENRNARVRRTRLVAVADVDWATNAFVGEAGNAKLLIQAVDWLTLDEDLVSVSPHIAALRPIDLTLSRARYARLLTAGVVPALFLLVGAFVWALRRAR